MEFNLTGEVLDVVMLDNSKEKNERILSSLCIVFFS